MKITPILCLIVCVGARSGSTQPAGLAVLSDSGMDPPNPTWRYQAGDDATWSNTGLDDSDWEPVRWSGFDPGERPQQGWIGIGWFRLRFLVDSSAANRPLGMSFYIRGAAEIFVDGDMTMRLGRPAPDEGLERAILHSDPNPAFASIRFARPGEHLIAIRHSNFSTRDFVKIGPPEAGVGVRIGDLGFMVERMNAEVRTITAQFAFTGVPLAFCLLFGLLYAFRREERNHLLFALLSLGIAAMTFLDLQLEFVSDPDRYMSMRRLFMAIAIMTVLTSVHFVYSLFEGPGGLHLRIIVVVGLVLVPWAVKDPLGAFKAGNIMLLLALVEMARIVTRAALRQKRQAWIIGIGLTAFIGGVAYDLLLDLSLIEGIARITNGYYYGFTALSIAMAAFLSQSFAKTTESLLAHERLLRDQEINRRILEADNERKTKELEEARSLQLSMLPKTLPQLDHLDLAVHMQTASEVGGDYYDFHLDSGRSVTLVVGDATGHGLKAGIMVAVAKSLFKAGMSEDDIPVFFNRCNRILRQMYLGNLFMAMTLVKIEGRRVVASAAGMPPLLIHRSETDEIEEVVLKGMPLGAFDGFPYEQFETDLEPGDTLLLLSDGLVELFSPTREMLGLDRVKQMVRQAGSEPPAKLIKRLEDAATEWRANRAQEDDITLVAVRMK